jgi:nucleotide-binding universal stress UspA family protein
VSKAQQKAGALRILLAVDGSATAERAARHVLALSAQGLAFEVLLLNVQPQWAPARTRDEKREGLRLHLERSEKAMRAAKALLADAGIAFKTALRVGDAAENILKAAREARCDEIVMGTRGLGALAGLMLGSVAMKVVQLAKMPVTLVK